MNENEQKRRGRKEKAVPQKSPNEYNAAERMRLARRNSGKSLAETGKELQYHPRHLGEVERGERAATRGLARQYEQLFGCEPGQIVNTVYEQPRKKWTRREPLQ